MGAWLSRSSSRALRVHPCRLLEETTMRRYLSVIAFMIALASAFGASAVYANDPPKKYKVTLPVLGDGFHYYPLYIAQAAGFFTQEGIEIDWVKVNGGNV